MYDAIVIGSGPNGLAAAIALAQNGVSVKVFEAADSIGGGTRTQELTLPGFRHDVCSAIHPMGAASPFLKTLPLEQFGLEWIHPKYPLAHPLDEGSAAVLQHSLIDTAASLEKDKTAYQKLFSSFVQRWDALAPELLGPINAFPGCPFLLGKFGLKALQPARRLAENYFTTDKAKALFAGVAAHSFLPLEKLTSAAIGLVMTIVAHTSGWPLPKGGSQQIAKAMRDYFNSLGGKIQTGVRIASLRDLPKSKVILFNNTPQQILDIAEDEVPASYAQKLHSYAYGPGVFKIDMALEAPIPWRDECCGEAGTVHLGGTMEEIAASERLIARGKHPKHPFVLLAQQSLFDDSRAPKGKHTVWAYCHVPNGSTKDMSEPILNQIERFAPGFRDCILDTHTMNTQAMETYNANYIGGDINGGKQDITQLFTRPAGLLDPYHIPKSNLFICSASTPPGGGVHGMCGYHAAQSAMKYLNK